MKTDLESAIEELETANEELRCSEEELLGVNEDLRAANEKLREASRQELEKLNAALRATNTELREVDRRKNEFLAVLSHELRNPLAPVRNAVYILQQCRPEGEQARHAIEIIDRQSRQMARLIDDLLDLTRITRNKVSLRREPLELNELVRRAIDDHAAMFAAGGIVLQPDLVPGDVVIDGDATRLAQVVGNLLQNAAKFTPPGGHVSVVTRVDRERNRATLEVRDDGIGIEPDVMGRLFEPFMQADSSLDRSRGGLGLGLALVKGIVEMHGGEVSGHSDGPGRGARFRIELSVESYSGPRPDVVAPEAPPARKRVLIIEDNADAASSLREVLALLGHEAEIAADGPEGLRRAREFVPDIVLCDIGLPGMDGYEVVRALRAEPALAGSAFVALTGYTQPDDVRRALRAGFDRHIAKPPSAEVLAHLLSGGSPPE